MSDLTKRLRMSGARIMIEAADRIDEQDETMDLLRSEYEATGDMDYAFWCIDNKAVMYDDVDLEDH